jgi:hypothetical protein
MEVMSPIFFLRNCNCSSTEIYVDNSYIFCNYEAVFPQSLHHIQHIFANVE